MLEYVKRLLLAQAKLAAQFDAAPQPEIREDALRISRMERNTAEEDASGREKQADTRRQDDAQRSRAESRPAEQMLREMARQTMRMQSMELRNTASEQMERTRRLEREMTALSERQYVDILARTPDSEVGGVMGSSRQTMAVAGIASEPSQRSMREISRFFERDARRYG